MYKTNPSEAVNSPPVLTCVCVSSSPLCTFGLSLKANDLLSGQPDQLVEVKLDVLPPVSSIFSVCLSRITRTA